MNAYLSPVKPDGKNILIVRDSRLMTWLNISDSNVKSTIWKFISEHDKSSVLDLISFCMTQDIECGFTPFCFFE